MGERFLLDTCVVSEQARAKPRAAVQAWMDLHPADALYLSVLSVAEIRQGIVQLRDEDRARQYARWLDGHVMPAFGDRLLGVDVAICERWGDMRGKALRAGRPMTMVESLLAATALVHDMAVVTRNVTDFEPFGVRIVNPWTHA